MEISQINTHTTKEHPCIFKEISKKSHSRVVHIHSYTQCTTPRERPNHLAPFPPFLNFPPKKIGTHTQAILKTRRTNRNPKKSKHPNLQKLSSHFKNIQTFALFSKHPKLLFIAVFFTTFYQLQRGYLDRVI